MLTRVKLAAALREVGAKSNHRKGYEYLAKRAETGEFDDYSDVHVCGPTALYGELKAQGFEKFAARVAAGEFDATLEESEAWARAQTDPETVSIMNAMGLGPDRSGDH